MPVTKSHCHIENGQEPLSLRLHDDKSEVVMLKCVKRQCCSCFEPAAICQAREGKYCVACKLAPPINAMDTLVWG